MITGHTSPKPPAPEAASGIRRPGQGRLVLLVAVVIAAAAVAFAVSRVGSPASHRTVAVASLPARPASYLGVYEPGAPGAYQPVAGFAKAAGRQPDIVGYFSGWTQPFARPFAERARGHGAVTIVQIDPTYASVPGIAAGVYDGYLRSYADSVRDFGHPVIIGFGHEMNASWYPWGHGHVPPGHVRGGLAARRDAVPRPGRPQRDLAVDAPGRHARHRAGALLVARRELCHLGRHRRLLLPPVRHLRQCLRPHHCPGPGVHGQARAAVRDRRGPHRGPGRQNQRSVHRDEAVRDARAWCGSTWPSTGGSTTRTGASKTVRRRRPPSGRACATSWPAPRSSRGAVISLP